MKLSSNANFCSLAYGTTLWLSNNAKDKQSCGKEIGPEQPLEWHATGKYGDDFAVLAKRLVNQMMVKNTMNPMVEAK